MAELAPGHLPPMTAPHAGSLLCQHCCARDNMPSRKDCRTHARAWRVPFSRKDYNRLYRMWIKNELPGQVKFDKG